MARIPPQATLDRIRSLTPPPPPGPRNYLGWGFLGSFTFYVLLILAAALYALIFHISTIAQFMKQGSLPQSGPAPEESIQVEIQEVTPPPPPPPDHVEFAKQVVAPKPVPVPIITKPVELPKPAAPPKAAVKKALVKPKYMAPDATGSGESKTASSLVVGSEGFPQPDYPRVALMHNLGGTVTLRIQFSASGSASSVEVENSSGVPILDNSAKSFILENWKSAAFAGKTTNVPIEFIPPN